MEKKSAADDGKYRDELCCPIECKERDRGRDHVVELNAGFGTEEGRKDEQADEFEGNNEIGADIVAVAVKVRDCEGKQYVEYVDDDERRVFDRAERCIDH